MLSHGSPSKRFEFVYNIDTIMNSTAIRSARTHARAHKITHTQATSISCLFLFVAFMSNLHIRTCALFACFTDNRQFSNILRTLTANPSPNTQKKWWKFLLRNGDRRSFVVGKAKKKKKVHLDDTCVRLLSFPRLTFTGNFFFSRDTMWNLSYDTGEKVCKWKSWTEIQLAGCYLGDFVDSDHSCRKLWNLRSVSPQFPLRGSRVLSERRWKTPSSAASSVSLVNS